MDFYVNPRSSDGHGTPSRTTVHRGDCVWAQRYGDGAKWRAFPTLKKAVAWAKTTPWPLNYCRRCDPCNPIEPVIDRLRKEIEKMQAKALQSIRSRSTIIPP